MTFSRNCSFFEVIHELIESIWKEFLAKIPVWFSYPKQCQFKHALVKRVLIQTWADPNVLQSNVDPTFQKICLLFNSWVYDKPLTINSKEAPGHADHEMEVRTKALTFLWLSLSIWRLYKFHHITNIGVNVAVVANALLFMPKHCAILVDSIKGAP